jgi:glycosyltransferase involved in cell wall biosynthesis
MAETGRSVADWQDRRSISVAFVTTCPPRQCGIATFSSDLAQAVVAADPSVRILWAVVNGAGAIDSYGSEVHWRIQQGQPDSYRDVAEQLNDSCVDVVSLQHEFGLYGVWGPGSFEDHLAPFLEMLRKPLVVTLHTVLPKPSPSVRQAVRRMGTCSQAVVVMAEVACRLLVDAYGVEGAKLRVVPHGVPLIEPRGHRQVKRRLGLEGRTVILTFGLLDPRKGIEYMICAMESVLERHPDALYLVVGKTHPELARHAGQTYRDGLHALVDARGLDRHVAFVDEYVPQQRVVDYLRAGDVYVTPYLDANQITSGTLSYALGAGKAIVSTSYPHATEALADGRGILVDFHSETQLAAAVNRILDSPRLRRSLERKAHAYGRRMAWPIAGRQMVELLQAAAVRSNVRIEAEPLTRSALARHSELSGRAAVSGLGSGTNAHADAPSLRLIGGAG